MSIPSLKSQKTQSSINSLPPKPAATIVPSASIIAFRRLVSLPPISSSLLLPLPLLRAAHLKYLFQILFQTSKMGIKEGCYANWVCKTISRAPTSDKYEDLKQVVVYVDF
ncbi:hypothetical protein Salat_2111400 [Sesamum alatum]|uniref:Uncharacterized protein n=1 Tax=Sesamum alatum TaxID=300844 RepID=A0AAE2CGS1_9LAMI|nr:hypothetical protein Salat_2111400 [Sesamum alatum]